MKYILLTASFIALTACTKTKCVKHYTSSIPMTLSPAKDTFHIGDTIWIESRFLHTIIDDSTQESVVVPDFDFKCLTGIDRIDTTPHVAFQEYKFEFIQDIGLLYYYYGIIPQYSYSNREYHLRYAIIPNYVGTYCMSASCPSRRLNPYESPDCKYYIDYGVTMNDLNLETNNYYMRLYSPDPLTNSISEEGFKYSGGYAFVVIP